jgi:hypothetical protein
VQLTATDTARDPERYTAMRYRDMILDNYTDSSTTNSFSSFVSTNATNLRWLRRIQHPQRALVLNLLPHLQTHRSRHSVTGKRRDMVAQSRWETPRYTTQRPLRPRRASSTTLSRVGRGLRICQAVHLHQRGLRGPYVLGDTIAA